MFYADACEIIQYADNMGAFLCNTAIHSYIIIQLVMNYIKKTRFKTILIVQSAAYILTGVAHFLRTFVNYVGFYYLLVTLATLLAIAATRSVFYLELEALQYYAMAVAVSAVVPTVLCHLAIKRYFRNIPCSDDVKRMQTKLSHGLLLQMALFANMVVLIVDVATYPLHDDEKKRRSLPISVYEVCRGAFLIWLPALTGFVIYWFTSGLFQKIKPQANVIVVSEFSPVSDDVSRPRKPCLPTRLS
ncbi:hypothetical protein Aduo_006133 [Ancylostoma duodenale]